MRKPKLNYQELSNQVRYVTKTTQDNDMTDRIGMAYTKKKTKLLWLIRLDTVYDEN